MRQIRLHGYSFVFNSNFSFLRSCFTRFNYLFPHWSAALPTSFSGADGKMHHCLSKHKLMDALESIQTIPGQPNDEDNATAPGE
jgi:hypothetical protein